MWARGRNNYWRNRKSRKRPRKKQVLCKSINLDVFTSSAFSVQSLCVYIYFPWDHIIWNIDIYSPTKITYANDTDLCLWKWATPPNYGNFHGQNVVHPLGNDDGWPAVTSCHLPKNIPMSGPLFFATWGWIPINIKFIITLGFWKYMNSSFVSSLY